MLSPTQTDALVALIAAAPTADAVSVALQTSLTLVSNASNDPAKGVLKTTNAGLQKRILGLTGGEAVLLAAGFQADANAGTLTWDATLPSDAAGERSSALAKTLATFDSIVRALSTVGDSNAPAQARDALKLCSTYVGNLVASPEAELDSKRRIGAANKALNGRLFAARGGNQLLLACGFGQEPATGEPEAFVCGLDTSMLRVTLATLEKGPAIWAALAAAHSTDDTGGDGGSSGGPKVTADEPSVAVDGIIVRSLPERAAVMGRHETRDMQPALCKSADGLHVLLLTWQCASKQWMQQGSMEVPGGDFEWDASSCMIILVDLGDAHGSGAPVPMRVPVAADGSVNEYVTARDFISEHEAQSYSQHKEPVLNMNWLEEVARKVRGATDPVLTTVRRLKAAMEAQH